MRFRLQNSTWSDESMTVHESERKVKWLPQVLVSSPLVHDFCHLPLLPWKGNLGSSKQAASKQIRPACLPPTATSRVWPQNPLGHPLQMVGEKEKLPFRAVWISLAQGKGSAWYDVCSSVCLELRMQEMVSMGIGNKPFMDIKPSDAAISDRAIDYIMKGAGKES